MRRSYAPLALALGLLLLVGCSDPNAGQVSGLVTLDRQPVAEGQITFTAEDGKAPTAGGPIKGGRYSVKVALGGMKVSISAPKVVGMKKLYPGQPNSPEQAVTVDIIPKRYNEQTKLRYDVPAGASEKNWELDAK